MKRYNSKSYKEAIKRISRIKNFFGHLKVYVMINGLILFIYFVVFKNILENNPNLDPNFSEWVGYNIWGTPIIWGLALLIHGIYVFGMDVGVFKRWERRKIKEYMEEDRSINNDSEIRWE